MPASPIGKLKMVAQVVAILALILGSQIQSLRLLGTVALWVAMAAALISAADYYRHFNSLLAVRGVPPREGRDTTRVPETRGTAKSA